jgi:hypothetical protein
VTVVSMSKQEFRRLEVLLRVQSGRLRIADACELIGLQRRQVFRLLRGLKVPPACYRSAEANPAITVCRPKFVLLPCRSLTEHHGCSVSRETLRGWM